MPIAVGGEEKIEECVGDCLLDTADAVPGKRGGKFPLLVDVEELTEAEASIEGATSRRWCDCGVSTCNLVAVEVNG